jgi:hypothetical protein
MGVFFFLGPLRERPYSRPNLPMLLFPLAGKKAGA